MPPTQIVTASELRVFQRCEREHANLYTLGYKPVEKAQALRFGSLVHVALEAWWRWRDDAAEGRLDTALAALAGAIQDDGCRVDDFERVRAEQMMRGYHATWEREPLTTLAVEVEFTTPIVDPDAGAELPGVVLGGKIDAIAADAQGYTWIVEHKTASDPGAATYWERLSLDLQCSVYLIGAEALGFKPEGVLYDVLGKPKAYPLKATPEEQRKYRKTDGALHAGQRAFDETPEEFRARLAETLQNSTAPLFRRGRVVRFPADELAAARDICALARRVVAARHRTLTGDHMVRSPDACSRYGRMCDFFGPCINEADINDPFLFRRSERAHEELSGGL
jgi:RecB family exonuclease